jgi:hypothetical protein
VIGLVFAFRYLQWILAHIKKLKKYTTPLLLFICIGILAVAVRFNYHYSPLPTTPSCWCVAYKVSDDDRTFDEALQKIPTDAIVSASPEVRPHVTHRLYSYTLPKATDSANFIAIIDQNRLPGDYGTKDYETQLIHQLRDDDRFTLVTQAGHFYLYKRN